MPVDTIFGLPISPKSATSEIPVKPTSAAGTGSKIRPITTAKIRLRSANHFELILLVLV